MYAPGSAHHTSLFICIPLTRHPPPFPSLPIPSLPLHRRWQKQWVPLRGYAAATLALLSRVDELRPLLVSAGAVPALVEMLDEHHPFVLSELPFSVTALLGVLPLDVSASNNDGPWVKAGGQPLTLAEVAATALLAITGRATLFRMPQGHNRAGGSGQPGGAFYQDVPFAEFFLMQVTTHLSTFGTVGVRDIIESGLPLTDAQSSFIADTRDTNMGCGLRAERPSWAAPHGSLPRSYSRPSFALSDACGD